MLDQEKKQEIITGFRRHDSDTGSATVQVALLTRRIQQLTDHLRQNQKDHSSRRGLLRMVSRRRKLLDYLNRTEPVSYRDLIGRLSLRK
ncbi:MAG: 30S ribosomal protein S15 [Candidatus Methylacidiphilaceae bacterium]|uniref:Small ribosomal subunit protein uS15 n=1 Tax=Methylacidimicrobium cyclopophantes TaxID=1041766 RepID=A0A5E6MNZ1_9BACT|nr:30S ribosomal protein S15 [Methylacidimicrobium cyclopophantes]VVM07166.1 30S ribosomal protein S15 [Methylacidimicrobium cyclopophantes]